MAWWLPVRLGPLLLFALLTCVHAAEPVDPRPGSQVADPDHRLSSSERASIDVVARETRAAGRGELLVIVVGTSGDRVLRTWGTELFNRWRIGDRTRNDGVLIISALDDRRCELVLGDGVDDPERVAASQRIFDEVMKPRFKEQDPGGALLAGAREAARTILTGVPELEAELPAVELPPGLAAPAASAGGFAPPGMEPPAVELPDDLPGPATSAPAGVSAMSLPQVPGWALAGGAGGMAVVGAWLLRRWIRLRARTCRTCGTPQERLGERADDAHLDSGERAEEAAGSVDHDVWSCPSCGRVDKAGWTNWFSGCRRCPACAARTRRETSTTLVRATEHSGGMVRVDGSCTHCGHADSRTRSTPRLSRSRNSSFGSSFGGSSRGSGGGGGTSSGRGGGGSW